MYFVLIFLMVLFTWQFEFKGKQIRFSKRCYWLLYLLFVFISGFRYRLGVDSVIYEDAFSLYPTLANYKWGVDYVSDSTDIFWALLNCFCKSFCNSFVLVQIVMAIFVNGVMFWFIKKHSSRPFFAVMLYFFTLWPLLTFEALREAIAVSFFIFALDSLIGEKNIIKYYLRVWPACFFHTFGFMTLLFPLIMLLRPGKISYIITFIASIIVVYAGYLISDTILPYITSDTIVAEKAIMYLESDTYGTNIWSVGGIIAIILGYVLPIVLMIYILDNSKDESTKWIIPFLLFMLIVSLFKISLPLVYRFFNYFYIVLVIAMTESIRVANKTKAKCFLSRIAVFIFVFMVLYGFSKPGGQRKYPTLYRYYPYNSIFTKDKNPKTEELLPL